MRVVMFYHSLVSDWHHGNAHFLRGVARDLSRRGHEVVVHEPLHGWSRSNLVADHGTAPLAAFERAYPDLREVSRPYVDAGSLDVDGALDGADVVIVHDWSDAELVRRIGAHRARSGRYALLFHATHHRSAPDPGSIAPSDLTSYDAVLALGAGARDHYLTQGCARRAFVWHEAADVTRFRPVAGTMQGDVVWVGDWGDEERTEDLFEFLIEPVRALRLVARVHGARYPETARRALADAGIAYAGWIPNFDVPSIFARFRATVHIPRRPRADALPGVPTIQPFEALACGIPMVSAPWRDEEALLSAGRDYLVARDSSEMRRYLGALMSDNELAAGLSLNGRRTIASRHTCSHRVDELLAIVDKVRERRD